MFDISRAKCHMNRCISYCRTSCCATVLFFFFCIAPAHLYRSLSNCFTAYRFILSAGVTELSEKCMWPYGKMLSAVLKTFRLSHTPSIILQRRLSVFCLATKVLMKIINWALGVNLSHVAQILSQFSCMRRFLPVAEPWAC